MRRRAGIYGASGVFLAMVAGIALVAAACGGDGSPPATADPVEFDIELSEFDIQPSRIEVPAGAPEDEGAH